ncbi:SAM-dependent methyltransferase [Nocardiopsis dassonvillei]|uniref:Methyltransferase type 12 n=2 Tax=Nocardiopsis TaxID=2013 RepID=D7B7D8_NOCDD|nr:class I SAM-dependent methyltransferase [Nocardiopsis dassonvillei]ADH67510.1 Methyltransferase type 12 [Nocardiopsis dassonvillei subsp. dassonvillei DSM 43111]NKY77653.1 class I SAM-dependent methyltransferase [Nocardiopsis dassonvillei]VEI87774.1 Predicted O-methyltransferase [Nocardiopsis dassonvillei]
MTTPPVPPLYRDVDFNGPLSDARAAGLIRDLGRLEGRRIVDIGCGWAELLLRALESEPTATGFGIDLDEQAVEHGRANAVARGLADRVELAVGDAGAWSGTHADVVVNNGASHVWGGDPVTHTVNALEAVAGLLRPGGRFLFGECFWLRDPTPGELEAMTDIPRAQYRSLPDLVDLALSHGFRLRALSQATLEEWDDFESRHARGWEEWLERNPGSPGADEVRARADRHRHFWLRGTRETLGFAYLSLARV